MECCSEIYQPAAFADAVIVPDIELPVHLKGRCLLVPERRQEPMIVSDYLLWRITQPREVVNQVNLIGLVAG